ncbi:MAG: anaerobic ribonucleoside-triphosphate reductase activating protein, partial [Christensenellaceae bacterium]|nr:anaerobic ribonucleoside-triphosphate reductase activating protein [Christensenellaceae bacterium]
SVGIKNYDTSKIEKSVSFLLEGRVDYEFRTTVVKEFNDEESFKGIAEWIKGAKKYFLQAFKDSGDLIDESVHGLSRDEMLALLPVFDKKVGKVEIRGMD